MFPCHDFLQVVSWNIATLGIFLSPDTKYLNYIAGTQHEKILKSLIRKFIYISVTNDVCVEKNVYMYVFHRQNSWATLSWKTHSLSFKKSQCTCSPISDFAVGVMAEF